MITSRNERRLIGAKDRWGTPIRISDTIRPTNGFIGPEGKVINMQGAYRVKTKGINGMPDSYALLFDIGPKNYEVLR